MLLVIRFFLSGIDYLMQNIFNGSSPFDQPKAIPVALSIFHTSFNVINTIMLIGFGNVIVNIARKMVKQKDEEDEGFRLHYIHTGIYITSEISILEAKKEKREILVFSGNRRKIG